MCNPSIKIIGVEELQVRTHHVLLCISSLIVGHHAVEVALIIVAERIIASIEISDPNNDLIKLC